MRIQNEEWPQSSAKGTKKRKLHCAIFFEPFAPFCGQMSFSFNEKTARIFGPE
jgi:hypothetical protein